MNLLLDSHALLWALHAPARMRAEAVALIGDPRRAVYFSAASAWELEIKAARGKLSLPADWCSPRSRQGSFKSPSRPPQRRPARACRGTIAIPSIASSSLRPWNTTST